MKLILVKDVSYNIDILECKDMADAKVQLCLNGNAVRLAYLKTDEGEIVHTFIEWR